MILNDDEVRVIRSIIHDGLPDGLDQLSLTEIIGQVKDRGITGEAAIELAKKLMQLGIGDDEDRYY